MKKLILLLLSIFGIWSIIFISEIWLTVSKNNIPSYGSIILKDSKGRVIVEKGRSGGYMVPYTGSLDRDIVKYIIQIEDNRFYSHHGVDIYGKIASIWENLTAGGIVRGGSTITEQYIKNTFYPHERRTFLQKIKEAIGSTLVEITETKETILRGYLDTIYFGNNTYGLAGIERIYSDHTLTKDDILDIITLINTPNIREENRSTPLAYREKVRKRLGIGTSETRLFEKRSSPYIERYPLVTQRVLIAVRKYCEGKKDELEKWIKNIGQNPCLGNTLEATLALDSDLMEYGRNALENILSPLTEKNVTNGAIYIYNPKYKKILAYIPNRQGSNREDSAIDMIQEKRSVGSVLKPFIYLLALKSGYDMNEYILDDTRVYPTGYSGKGFVPLNYVEKSYGPVRLREALGNSLNASTVRLSEELQIGRIYDFFREKGLDLNHDAGYYGYGISLGSVELTLQNIVESYAQLIDITDSDLFLLSDTLRDNSNRGKTFGLSSILNTSLPQAVKTGTSTDFRDNWTVSYNPSAIVGVWVGNSDSSPMNDVSGVSGAGPLWHSIVEYMISRGMISNEDDIPPKGIEKNTFCLDKKCYQKEIRYTKIKAPLLSRPLDKIYYEADFVTRMTQEEKEKWKIRAE